MRADHGSLIALICAAAIANGCAGMYAPTAPDTNWNVVNTARLSLYVRPASFCAGIAAPLGEVLEEQYDHTVALLGLRSAGRISVFLYNSASEPTPRLESDYSGVAFPDTGAVHAVCVAPFDDNLKALVAHEVNHVIINQGLGRAGTSFMNEGLASALISERFGALGPSFLYQWTRTHRRELLPIAALADDARWQSSSQAGYNTSASFLAWLLDRYGRDRLRELYGASSARFTERTRDIYGKTVEALEAEWLIQLETL